MSDLQFLFCGDFAPSDGYEKIIIEKKVDVLNELRDIIGKSDLSFVNLECPLTRSLEPIKKSGPAIKSDPECIKILKGFTVIGLANNHIMDFGYEGLKETTNACASENLSYIGAGDNNESANKVFYKIINDITVAVIAVAENEFSQSSDKSPGSATLDPIDNWKQIKEAKDNADIILMTIHAGNEFFPYPRPGLRKLLHHYIDLGVDAIVCHHPHIAGAYEYYNSKPIIYSLGNLIFDSKYNYKEWNIGYLAKLKFDSNSKEFSSLELIPYEQTVLNEGVKLLQGKKKQEVLNEIENLKDNLMNDKKWLEIWDEFVNKKSNEYIIRQYLPLLHRGKSFLAKYAPWLVKMLYRGRKTDLDKLNLIRCQSHLELLVSVLDRKFKNEKIKK